MFDNRAGLEAKSPNVWARKTRSRGMSLARWAAALPILAVLAIARGPGPASAQDTVLAAPPAVLAGRWSPASAQALLSVIDASRAEGLNPADYSADALRVAIASGQRGPVLDATADSAAMKIAHDYADGHIDDKASFDWHIAPSMDDAALNAGLAKALAENSVDLWLQSLLPDNDQYRALKAAYALTEPGDAATRETLRTNMERWRWMPRKLGDHYLYVNIPTYRLQDMQDGIEQAAYNVVVGAPETPTPQLALQAQSIVVNPSWNLPPTVLKEGKIRPGAAATAKGYSFTRRADGSLAIRQAPGPQNALGRIKFDMPNPWSIYLHDTPSKWAFAKSNRALSHGCVRVQNIDQLAASIKDEGAVDSALAERTTKTLQLEKSLPVYIVYFTAQADADGKVRYLDDPYRRDPQMKAKLNTPLRMAAR
ncbi:Murein L,D-transpeptidase YcbB/YkuD [Sphingomonas sp. YR710]|uniref:L,D-transpeptidase family protein n=1 Tax=Sphingomonas sp. YR710 TaxID=1882773 RepID=UPI0008927138|nr:L,D-transpeptidase family protein [Sphingomonas sp. YR710]SDC02494.1 Murein L,D-transpeptidase YcbB/YkuD [Sphingomonas sp. YR710]